MAKVGRFAGALLLQTENHYYLIGELKEPAKFEERGFYPPPERVVLKQPSILLEANGEEIIFDNDFILTLEGNDDTLNERLVTALMIFRNGSISERLWGLITETSECENKLVKAQWLVDMPEDVWDVVRDSVLRC